MGILRSVFQVLFLQRLFACNDRPVPVQSATDSSLIELAAFHLFASEEGQSRDPKLVEAILEKLDELQSNRPMLSLFQHSPDDPAGTSQALASLSTETIRGSAYPSQLRDKIRGIQVPHDTWFQRKCGISPSTLLAVLPVIEECISENFMSAVKSAIRSTIEWTDTPDGRQLAKEKAIAILDQVYMSCPVTLQQLQSRLPSFTESDWQGLKQLVGLTTEARKLMTAPVDVKDRPFYFVPSGGLLLFCISSAYDSVFWAFDGAARSDGTFRDSYGQTVAGWMEPEIERYFQRLFPRANVFRSLGYPDPDVLNGEAELDLLVHWGPFLLLVECKGKQFSKAAQRGNAAKLRRDLEKNIADSFRQATRAKRYIESTPTIRFKEINSERVLIVDQSRIVKIFCISVTLENFLGIATQLATLEKIGLFKDKSYPWSVSIADLDIITRFAGHPDVFLHYVQRRIELQESHKEFVADELDLFGHYLENRLPPSKLWDNMSPDGKAPSMLAFPGGSESFDQWFDAERREQTPPEIQFQVPLIILNILTALRCRTDDEARWIAFALLNLSNEGFSHLKRALEDLYGVKAIGRKVPRMFFWDRDLLVNILSNGQLPLAHFEREVGYRCVLEKYRLKARRSLALGFNFQRSSPELVGAAWVEGEWQTAQTRHRPGL